MHYTLATHDQTLHADPHGQRAARLHDFNTTPQGKIDKLTADALVRSGDYLSTLATQLDSISIELALTDVATHEELERIINTLLYLDTTYKLIKK